jgi:adenylate kinase family enzyme
VVVGTTGSGKTTLAGQLADRLGLPHVELDALNWGPNWTQRDPDEFLALLAEATKGDGWVTCGNYSRTRDMLWSRADTLIWLDYSLPLVLWRLWWRTIRRFVRREVLWNGNKERLWEHLFTRQSLFLWALQTYGRRRREYPILLKEPQYAHLQVFHFHSPGQTEKWLNQIATGQVVLSPRE